jgi:hypothetical protein
MLSVDGTKCNYNIINKKKEKREGRVVVVFFFLGWFLWW